jgi:hypothetical protein
VQASALELLRGQRRVKGVRSGIASGGRLLELGGTGGEAVRELFLEAIDGLAEHRTLCRRQAGDACQPGRQHPALAEVLSLDLLERARVRTSADLRLGLATSTVEFRGVHRCLATTALAGFLPSRHEEKPNPASGFPECTACTTRKVPLWPDPKCPAAPVRRRGRRGPPRNGSGGRRRAESLDAAEH